MALKDLIPAEFFVLPPPKPSLNHGHISLCTHALYRGGVLVAWDKGCPLFSENLEAARLLKAAGLGTYRPEAGGWVFNPAASARIVAAFPKTLVVDADVLALVEKNASPAPAGPAAPVRKVHGSVKLIGDQYHVSIGGPGCAFIEKPLFGQYVDAARTIRNEVNGCRGWVAASKTWAFGRAAAGRIVKAYPAVHFDHCPELKADAEKYPAPAAAPAALDVPDAYATRLLAVADAMLATL